MFTGWELSLGCDLCACRRVEGSPFEAGKSNVSSTVLWLHTLAEDEKGAIVDARDKATTLVISRYDSYEGQAAQVAGSELSYEELFKQGKVYRERTPPNREVGDIEIPQLPSLPPTIDILAPSPPPPSHPPPDESVGG